MANSVTWLFCNAKFVYRLLLVALAWIQYNAGEVGAVGRIWEVLSLQTNGRTTGEGAAVGTFIAVRLLLFCSVHSCGHIRYQT